ncbi:MAG TPA: GNAT family N-acetyltransferase [Candidatus Limnocylindrales bacterium]|nr:GNAT family N-acetyltransferase [Candidatus Limnocylindrales bacterium]
MTRPHEATPDELDDWDRLAVDRPGGHVYQSRAWAEHRAGQGWRPRFLAWEDGERALALARPWPLVGGAGGYVPRGPRPVAGAGAEVAERLVGLAEHLAAEGVDVLAADPEVPAADGGYRRALGAAGFRPIEELQPSRHRMTRPLEGLDEDGAMAAVAKSTRQRIRQAERAAVRVVRHDVRAGAGDAGEGFEYPAEPGDVALDRFYDLLLETGERRGFGFGSRTDFVGWWRAALAAGHLVLLEAWPPCGAGEAGSPGSGRGDDGRGPLAGLILYRHGERLSTVHSGDRADARRDQPGALHLLRWRAMQLAIREGRAELDLGGVDVPGARREPRRGDPMWGLYEHKRTFGGEWLELAGAHERVARPVRYAAGRIALRAARLLGGRPGRIFAPGRRTGSS